MADRTGTRVRAAILAGGRASRLGGEKATADLAGRPLIAYPLEAAREAGLDPLIVAKAASALPDLGCDVVREPDEPVHPLLGILTAMEATGGPVLALGCDMPFVTAPLLRWLADRDPPAIAVVGGRPEPLLALYGADDAAALAAALAEEAPLREAAERLGPERVGETELARFGDPGTIVRSVNSEADLVEAALLLSG
ncbi:MAG TPA: molybdenum cofactor guanylyltransferase [Solirubrobacterales bacterium]|jgi:molybdopterin-guanine dinucleotide biosynthesis protein A